jgi:IS5 family transposase
VHTAPGGGGCRLLPAKNEAAAKAKGVKRVCIPNRSTKSRERKREQKKRWFRNGQKWRTGCAGKSVSISVVGG